MRQAGQAMAFREPDKEDFKMHDQFSQSRSWRSPISAALLCLTLVALNGLAYAQGQIPKLTFATDGLANFNGDASSSGGALRGNIKFTFNGSVDSQRLSISGYVSLPQQPAGNTSRFWRLRVTGYGGAINQQGKPQVEFRRTDPTYDILTISNLPAVEDFTRTGAQWKGVARIVLRFSKVNGVADVFSVEFTPVSKYLNPPAAVRGSICNARLKVGSDLILAIRN
jgi:hypothetical protein